MEITRSCSVSNRSRIYRRSVIYHRTNQPSRDLAPRYLAAWRLTVRPHEVGTAVFLVRMLKHEDVVVLQKRSPAMLEDISTIPILYMYVRMNFSWWRMYESHTTSSFRVTVTASVPRYLTRIQPHMYALHATTMFPITKKNKNTNKIKFQFFLDKTIIRSTSAQLPIMGTKLHWKSEKGIAPIKMDEIINLSDMHYYYCLCTEEVCHVSLKSFQYCT